MGVRSGERINELESAGRGGGVEGREGTAKRGSFVGSGLGGISDMRRVGFIWMGLMKGFSEELWGRINEVFNEAGGPHT